jgi:lipocalin
MANKNEKPLFLLSSDTLSSYGLDLVFEVAKESGYDGVDLALWKNFDAWNT